MVLQTCLLTSHILVVQNAACRSSHHVILENFLNWYIKKRYIYFNNYSVHIMHYFKSCWYQRNSLLFIMLRSIVTYCDPDFNTILINKGPHYTTWMERLYSISFLLNSIKGYFKETIKCVKENSRYISKSRTYFGILCSYFYQIRSVDMLC